jgi:hypothetical protein
MVTRPVNYSTKDQASLLSRCSCYGLALSIIIASLAGVLPMKYLVKEGDLLQPPPIIDVISVNYNEDCPAGSTPTSSVTIPPTLLPEACVCPKESSAYVESRYGACSEVLSSHGCTSIFPTTPSAPLTRWHWYNDLKICIKRGGTPVISYSEDGVLVIRPSYDPSSHSYCPDGFRRCGNGICFDVGVECPVIDISWRNGRFHGDHSGRDADFDLQPLTNLGFEEAKYGRFTKSNLLTNFPPSRCSPSFPALPEGFTCAPGDTICSSYASPSCATLASFSTLGTHYEFTLRHEVSPMNAETLEGKSYSDYPTTISQLRPILLSPLIPIYFIAVTFVVKQYGFVYDDPCGFHPAESMTELRGRFRRIGWSVWLLLMPVFAWMCYNLYLAKKAHEIPEVLLRGNGQGLVNVVFILSVLSFVGMGGSFVLFFISSMWSCFNWDDHGYSLWIEEQLEIGQEKRRIELQRKKEEIENQVSQMSSETKGIYCSALSPPEQKVGQPCPV